MMKLTDFCNVVGDPLRVEMLRYIKDHMLVTATEIGSVLCGCPENMVPVRKHLTTLCDAGFIVRTKVGREYVYNAVKHPASAIENIEQLYILFDTTFPPPNVPKSTS
jgi:predicted ArsR family transcriptional regulator